MVTKRDFKCLWWVVFLVLVLVSLVCAGTGQRSLTAKGVEQDAANETVDRANENFEPKTPEGLGRIPPLWEAEEETPSIKNTFGLPKVAQEKLKASVQLINSLNPEQRKKIGKIFGRHETGLKALKHRTLSMDRKFGRGDAAPSFGEMRDLIGSVKDWKADLNEEVATILNAEQQKLYDASQVELSDPTDADAMEKMGVTEDFGAVSPDEDAFGLSTSDCYRGYYYHYYQYLNDYYACLYAYYGYAATYNTNAYYAYLYCYYAYYYGLYACQYCYWGYYYSSSTYAYYGLIYGSDARYYAYWGYYYAYYAYYATYNTYCYYAYISAYYGYKYAYFGYQSADVCYNYTTYNKILPVPLYGQEYNQWCWAGTAQMIMAYKSGFSYSQCGMANYVRDYTTCCNSSPPSYCNYPTYLDENVKLYNGYGFNNTAIENYISFSAVKTQIDAHRPFFWGWYWTGGGGHAMAVNGYYDGYTDYVYYNDPWEPQAKVCVYSTCVSASDHTWGSTIYDIY